LKRVIKIITVLIGIGLLGLLTLLVWQPDAWKKRVIDIGLGVYTRGKPYRVTVHSAEGNFFRTLTLRDVRVRAHPSGRLIGEARQLDIQIIWKKLLDKQLAFREIALQHAQGHMFAKGYVGITGAHATQWNVRARLQLPEHPPVELIARGEIAGYASDFSRLDVHLRTIAYVHPRAAPRVRCGVVLFRLERGRGTLRADAQMPSLQAHVVSDLNLLRKEARGTWQIQESSFKDIAVWVPALKELQGALQAQGEFAYRAGQGRLQGQGTGQNFVWKDRRLKNVAFQFETHGRDIRILHVTLEDLALHPQQTPWDIQTARLDQTPGHRVYLTAAFRNSIQVVAGGRYSLGTLMEARLNRLEVNLPGEIGLWRLSGSGTQIVSSPRTVEIKDLLLMKGSERFAVPLWRLDKKSAYLTARVETDVDPALLNTFFPGVISGGGRIRSALQIAGRWPHLAITGPVTASVPAIQKKEIGLNLHHIDLDIACTPDVITVRNLVAQTKKGELRVTGSAHLPQLDFALKSRNFRIAIPDQGIKARTDIQLRLAGTLDAPDITGDISLGKSVYDAAAVKKSKKKSAPQENPAGERPTTASAPESRPSIWLSTAMDITVHWDRDVWYRDGITGIETQANIRLRKDRGAREPLLTGQIVSLRGTYAYFGREFVIESAQIRFPGTPGINPLLNVEASYRSDPTLVYLDLTGELKQPTLKLRSIPPLPDQDVVSVLVFGRPLSQLNTSGSSGTTGQQMAGLAGSVLGSYITKSLRETGLKQLDLDVLEVQPAQQGASRVTVGRYLTRNLFVSYGQTMSQTGSHGIAADYYLGPHWVLEGEAGTADSSHMDLLFRYPLFANAASDIGTLRQSPFRNTLDRPDATTGVILPE
jgi:hypothetical protein